MGGCGVFISVRPAMAGTEQEGQVTMPIKTTVEVTCESCGAEIPIEPEIEDGVFTVAEGGVALFTRVYKSDEGPYLVIDTANKASLSMDDDEMVSRYVTCSAGCTAKLAERILTGLES